MAQTSASGSAALVARLTLPSGYSSAGLLWLFIVRKELKCLCVAFKIILCFVFICLFELCRRYCFKSYGNGTGSAVSWSVGRQLVVVVVVVVIVLLVLVVVVVLFFFHKNARRNWMANFLFYAV